MNFTNSLQSAKLDDILLQKLQTKIINNIDKKIPRFHINKIYKIISYDNDKNYITCSKDKTIIIRNCEDNSIIKTLSDHKESVCDIIILSDGRLASASEDKKSKYGILPMVTASKHLLAILKLYIVY